MSPTREETLRELLARVHERLSHAREVDEPSRALLVKVMQDIGRTLETKDPAQHSPAPNESSEAEPLSDPLPRLEALAVRFETEHPALGQGLRQLIDYLSNAGI